jgi:hypothetical protein
MFISGFSIGAGHVFATYGAAAQGSLHYSFSLEKEKSICMDGLKVNINESGDLWGAVYESGAAVRHNDRYSMAKGENNMLWLGDRKGMWHPLD